jgi:hypothetical protein
LLSKQAQMKKKERKSETEETKIEKKHEKMLKQR